MKNLIITRNIVISYLVKGNLIYQKLYVLEKLNYFPKFYKKVHYGFHLK